MWAGGANASRRNRFGRAMDIFSFYKYCYEHMLITNIKGLSMKVKRKVCPGLRMRIAIIGRSRENPSSKSANAKPPDIASASIPDTLATLQVSPETRLTHAEVDVRRKENGYNEVAEKKGHPVPKFLKKFWGISAWMLELIMILSAVLGKYSDLVVVGALLVINAVLSFMQESRAAGVVAALRKRLQVNARVRRDSSWQVISARELVPGDIVRVRPGDIIPADVKLLLQKWKKPHSNMRLKTFLKRWKKQCGNQNPNPLKNGLLSSVRGREKMLRGFL
jgi:hypothetical protein